MKKSPKRNTKLDSIRESTENESKSVHALCPTRWTVRGQVLESFLNNYHELMELWAWSLEEVKDTEMKARIRGAMTVMKTFEFIFCCCLGECLLNHTDNLSKALQRHDISAAEGQALATEVLAVLSKNRSDEMFDLFWNHALKWREDLRASEPTLPRKRKVTDHFQNISGPQSSHHFHDTPKDRYRQLYFEVFDYAINCIKDRFDQPDYNKYIHLQEVLLKAIKGENWKNHFQEISKFYKGDFDLSSAKAQICLLPGIATTLGYDVKSFTIVDLISFLQSLNHSQRALLTEVVKIAKLLLVMPATNAISERSFSALKRIKTYLRSTTSDSRLNNLLVLHVHKELVDDLDLKAIGNIFIDKCDSRLSIFGSYSLNDCL